MSLIVPCSRFNSSISPSTILSIFRDISLSTSKFLGVTSTVATILPIIIVAAVNITITIANIISAFLLSLIIFRKTCLILNK